jgi:hypothetical protein
MNPWIRFSTGRLLLATAVLAVWIAVLVAASKRVPSGDSMAPWVGNLFFVASTFLQCAVAAVIVRTLGKRSIVAAFLGAGAYVALLGWLSFATWG